jgi:hypothetical protein
MNTYAKLYKQDNCILDFGVLFSLFFFSPFILFAKMGQKPFPFFNVYRTKVENKGLHK